MDMMHLCVCVFLGAFLDSGCDILVFFCLFILLFFVPLYCLLAGVICLH